MGSTPSRGRWRFRRRVALLPAHESAHQLQVDASRSFFESTLKTELEGSACRATLVPGAADGRAVGRQPSATAESIVCGGHSTARDSSSFSYELIVPLDVISARVQPGRPR
jgi:hypothetical protein